MARCQSIFNLSADNFRLVELRAGALLGVLSLKSVLLGVLRHQRNLFCLPGEVCQGEIYPHAKKEERLPVVDAEQLLFFS